MYQLQKGSNAFIDRLKSQFFLLSTKSVVWSFSDLEPHFHVSKISLRSQFLYEWKIKLAKQYLTKQSNSAQRTVDKTFDITAVIIQSVTCSNSENIFGHKKEVVKF